MTLIDRTGPVALPQSPTGPVRLLAGARLDTIRLAEHRERHPVPPAPGRARTDLIDLVDQAGLRGRGGAAFPTATKLRAVAAAAVAAGERPVVVVNGAEGEPLSDKDAVLLQRVPHLVLDGAVLAAGLIGADQVHVAGDRATPAALQAIDQAIVDRRAAGEPLAGACHTRPTPSHFVAGEETALVQHLNGGPALPTSFHRPYRRGVGDRPTLILNPETAAHLAQILLWGPAWFRSEGTDLHPGTTLVTVSGTVQGRSVHEVALGTPLTAVADLAGGFLAAPQAVLVGGYFGTWVAADGAASVGLCNEELHRLGAAVGCGAVAFLATGACGVRESSRVVRWLAGQTAGQCGPCVHGLAAIADQFDALAAGTADPHGVARLHRWAAQVDGRGACRFPDGAVRFLRSALHVFADDVRRHEAGLACPPGHPVLPTPAIPVTR